MELNASEARVQLGQVRGGEQVPVIHIDGQPHDFFRVDEIRFRKALTKR